jgi:hypothetical protein
VSGEGFSIGMTLYDAHRRRVPTQWSYDPRVNPLVIGINVAASPGTAPLCIVGSEDFVIDRTLLVGAFEHAPRVHGHGVVRLWVSKAGLRIALFVPGRVPVMLAASTDAVLAFGHATMVSVPVCAGGGYCEHPACVECAWLRRQVPFCPCGSPGCFYHRPAE